MIGYDCGGENLNITSLSLLDIGDCDMENIEPIKRETYIQLMQVSEYDKATIIQCKIEIDRTIYYCGMHSHISAVHNGRREYISEIGEQACKSLHSSGSITVNNAVISGIRRNITNYRSITLAGSTSVGGSCSGSQYSDSYGTWDSVVVQASIRLTLRAFEAPVKRSTGHIILPSGSQCPLAAGFCLDSEGAETFWSALPTDSCHFDQYDILYEGIATKLLPRENQTTPAVYTVTTKETTFALTRTTEMNLCGYKLLQTEHPKLFILETSRGHTFKSRSKIAVDNLDIFSYVNSKFIYVEKHVRTQLTQLYRDIMEQKCALEHQVLQNALSLASIAPDEMAFRIMKSPGYTAVTSGEVLHLIKCVPVECKIRLVESCYHELPVTHRNQSYFLAPRSRILVRTSTPRDCDGFLPATYRIDGAWYKLTPRPVEVLAPPTIQPLTRPAWRYNSPAALATSGIYSTEDLDRLRAHIMFPVEKPSVLNTMAQGAMGRKILPGSISMLNLLDEEALNKIAESAGERIWKGFISFGSASAGILAIFLIIRVAKLIIDTVIHGYALHTIYGWSMHLIGALWSSVTHLLIHLGGDRRNKDSGKLTNETTPPPAVSPQTPAPENASAPGTSIRLDVNTECHPYHPLQKYLAEDIANKSRT